MRNADRFRRIAARTCLAAALALCAPVSGARADSARTSEALRTALRDPGTWIPALAALIVSLSGRDRAISDRAIASTPVFRSNHGALEASDVLRDVSYFGMVVTTPLIPGARSSFQTWGETVLAEHAGIVAGSGVTWTLKRLTGRVRPTGGNRRSFPSGHATRAFAHQAAASYNLDRSTLADPARIGLDVAMRLAASGTAWARVEGGAHYATDVLAGAAIGNFLGRFCAEALVPEEDRPGTPRPPAGFPGVMVSVRF